MRISGPNTGTWFTRLREQQSGRIVPSILSAPLGDHVFVLGAEGDHEPAVLRHGDSVIVRQRVDLTGVDMIEATLETVGVAMSVFEHLPAVPTGCLAHWPMDRAWVHAENNVQPGPSLLATGAVAVGTETYSPVPSPCRTIPAGTLDSQLVGVNNPPLFSWGGIAEYTIRAWLNFDADAIVDSEGTTPNIFSVTESGAGYGFTLVGEGGAGPNHKWWPALVHTDGATTVVVVFEGYAITTSTGWHMLTATFNSAAGVDIERCSLYVDGVFACFGSTIMTIPPNAPSPGAIMLVGSPELVGDIDNVLVAAVAGSAGDVNDDYLACTTPPASNAARWRMQIIVDGDVYCDRVISESEHRVWTDFRAPVRHLVGGYTVEFKLWIEEA